MGTCHCFVIDFDFKIQSDEVTTKLEPLPVPIVKARNSNIQACLQTGMAREVFLMYKTLSNLNEVVLFGCECLFLH